MSENYTWNSALKPDEEPTWLNLPDGEHDFTVEDIAFGHYAGGAKIPACPMAEVTLTFQHPEGGTNKIIERLYLYDKGEWKIKALAKAVGATGESYGELLSACKGKAGRAKVGHREYNGNTYNQVDRYLPKKAPAFEPGKF